MPHAWPGSAPRHRIGIFATEELHFEHCAATVSSNSNGAPQAWDDGVRIPSPRSSGRQGLSCVRRAEPAFYSAMFESGVPVDSIRPCCRQANALRVIRAAAERLAALAPPGTPRPPAMMMALHIWSMSHAWRRCSRVAMRRAASCRCPPKICSKPKVLIYSARSRVFDRPPGVRPKGSSAAKAVRSFVRSLGQPKINCLVPPASGLTKIGMV